MPYLNIPYSKLAPSISRMVGNMQGEITGKVQSRTSTLRASFANQCPTQENLVRIMQERDNLMKQAANYEKRLDRIRKVPKRLRNMSKSLLATVRVLKKVPIPTSVPPGFGVPLGLTNSFADMLHLAKEYAIQARDDADAIDEILNSPVDTLGIVRSSLESLDGPLQACIVRNGLDFDLQRQLGLTEYIPTGTSGFLQEVSTLDKLAPLLLNQDRSGRILSQNTEGLGELVTALEPILTPDTKAGDSSNGVNQKEPIISDQNLGSLKKRGDYLSGQIYIHTEIQRDTVRGSDGVIYIVNNPSKSGLNTWGNPVEKIDWTILEPARLKRPKPSPGDQFIRGGDGKLYTESEIRNTFNKLDETLNNLDKSSLTEAQALSIDTLQKGIVRVQSGTQDISPEKLEYTSTQGQHYIFKIKEDKKGPSIAPLRYAVAVNDESVEVLRGASSFSSSTEVLIAELKFRIENQLP